VVEHSNPPWHVHYGPIEESLFPTLPETHWTLLINDVEKWLPELSWIVDQFRFIPEWLIDDLMISYAPEGGSVGPHLDRYDVFILQAQGHRRWQINTQPVSPENHIDNIDLCIQKSFTAEQEWVLAPGDIIYIPPGTSHHGVALDDCMSFSIGFRAPAHSALLHDFLNHFSRQLNPEDVFRLPNLTSQPHPCELPVEAFEQAQDLINTFCATDNPEFKQWFTQFMSENNSHIPCDDEHNTIMQLPDITTDTLHRNPASRFVFSRDDKTTWLAVDGTCYPLETHLTEQLCFARDINLSKLTSQISEEDAAILILLLNAQHLLLGNCPVAVE